MEGSWVAPELAAPPLCALSSFIVGQCTLWWLHLRLLTCWPQV